jgi:hypothetical protein
MHASQPRGIVHLEPGGWVVFENRLYVPTGDLYFFVVSKDSSRGPASLVNISNCSFWRFATNEKFLRHESERYGFMCGTMNIYPLATADVIAKHGADKVQAVYQAVEKKGGYV